jgi:hypothetical protein
MKNIQQQEIILNHISDLFKKIELVAETSGFKPDEISEILPFNYIDDLGLRQPDIRSLASSRKHVFESAMKTQKV